MVNTTTQEPGSFEVVKTTVQGIVSFINNTLASLIPGKEEYAVIALAIYLGYLWRNREWSSGGYELWAKATIVFYIVLKILGLGKKLI